MIKGILFLTLLLNHIAFAGTIINPTINNNNNSKTYFGKNNSKGGGNIYNDKVTINSNRKSESKTNSTTNNRNTNFNANVKTNVNGLQKILIDIF